MKVRRWGAGEKVTSMVYARDKVDALTQARSHFHPCRVKVIGAERNRGNRRMWEVSLLIKSCPRRMKR